MHIVQHIFNNNTFYMLFFQMMWEGTWERRKIPFQHWLIFCKLMVWAFLWHYLTQFTCLNLLLLFWHKYCALCCFFILWEWPQWSHWSLWSCFDMVEFVCVKYNYSDCHQAVYFPLKEAHRLFSVHNDHRMLCPWRWDRGWWICTWSINLEKVKRPSPCLDRQWDSCWLQSLIYDVAYSTPRSCPLVLRSIKSFEKIGGLWWWIHLHRKTQV